jgi:hypothetical protein
MHLALTGGKAQESSPHSVSFSAAGILALASCFFVSALIARWQLQPEYSHHRW